jgi:hypothetical protein
MLGMVFGEGSQEQEKQPALMPIMACFSVIRDPRIERNKLYPLYEVIVITIPAVIATAQVNAPANKIGNTGEYRPPVSFAGFRT